MTEPHTPETSEEARAAASSSGAEDAAEPTTPEAEPQPEPWTAERVVEWNAYYDIYVVLGVVFLAFVASANRIAHSEIWTQLKAGQIMASRGAPMLTDEFSYTELSRRWVNIPWLFEWGMALVHKAAQGLVSPDPNDVISPTRWPEQVGAGVLVGLSALVRVATVLVLLAIRRPGPGLWWTAVCATLAVGAIYSPLGLMLGGIAGPGIVSPATWAQLFVAIELLLLHRTIERGYRRAAYGLVPLFMLWANVDPSFAIGLLLLAAVVAGRISPRLETAGQPETLPLPRGLLLLGACVLACLANPSLHHALVSACDPFIKLFQPAGGIVSKEDLSYFGPELRRGDAGARGALWKPLLGFYFFCVVGGLASFVVNRRRFSLSRFLVYVAAALLWAVYMRFSDVFGLVLAAVLATNGQEWYLERFGAGGRLGRGWTLWSTGGRFVTILLVFACAAECLTGYGRAVGDAQFGFGYNPDEFAFEAADFLRSSKIRGNVLNTTRLQGDSLVWRAYPQRKTFIDGRHNLFPRALQGDLMKTRSALADDDIKGWKPLLDRYEITAVMIEAAGAPRTYRTLMHSANWIPFYDDGNIVMFGRADAPAADLAFFKENRLEAERLVYEESRPLPPSDRTPTPIGKLDRIFYNRFLIPPQPHDEAARRWLEGTNAPPGTPALPDPAHCLLAIREARIALSRRPDDTQAYRIMSVAYQNLMVQETALLAGLTLTPKDQAEVIRLAPRIDLLMNRFRQRATALNFAIQSTPPPRLELDRQTLLRLHYELYQLYLAANFNDLARDRLQAMLAKAEPKDLEPDFRAQLSSQLSQLDEGVRQVQDQMGEMVAEQQASPLERANFALRNGAPGLAIQEYEEALQINVSPTIVKPRLLDLYCDTGQPEKALDLLANVSIDDPTLGTEPGMAALRQGRVYFLLGNYEYAATLWQKNAISQLRYERSFSTTGAGRALVHGDWKSASTTFMNLPSKLAMQASWENDLALCLLESGHPTAAADYFKQALTLAPALPTRAVSAYYLEKLGGTVPPIPKEDADEAAAPSGPPAAETKPAK